MPDPVGTTPEPTLRDRRGRRLALAVAIALAPVVVAIWTWPWFVTQDGPAHLYNAQILAEVHAPDSPYRPYYAVRWQPLPNWAGHLLYLVLGSALPPGSAERAAATLTLVALASATAWLRFRVTGGKAIATTAIVSAMVGLNVTWLFGFTGFLLGASLFPITLAVWWDGRDRMTWRRSIALAALVVLGYFCHPVSLGMTTFGLLVLATVGKSGRGVTRATLLKTVVALLPLVPLGLIYRGLTRAGGPLRPEWAHLTDLASLRSWAAQLGWVDPISLAAKVYRPFGTQASYWNGLTAPVAWLAIGLGALAVVTLRSRDRERRGWGLIAGFLLLAGLLGPDTLGASHGHYLQQRVVLLGLVALGPWLKLDAPGRLAWIGRACLVIALSLQSLFVWDYARESHRSVGRLMASAEDVGRGNRVATILLDDHCRFRSNPLFHAECLLGVGTGNVIWGDYETTHYYFPVQLRDPDDSPPATALEMISRLQGPDNAPYRARLWAEFLQRYQPSVDVVLIGGSDPEVERITATWFDRRVILGEGRVQVWSTRRRDRTGKPRR